MSPHSQKLSDICTLRLPAIPPNLTLGQNIATLRKRLKKFVKKFFTLQKSWIHRKSKLGDLT